MHILYVLQPLKKDETGEYINKIIIGWTQAQSALVFQEHKGERASPSLFLALNVKMCDERDPNIAI